MSQKKILSNLATQNITDNIYVTSELSALAPRPYMNRREGERRILKLIAMGDLPLLEERFQQMEKTDERIELTWLSEDRLTHLKYIGIIMAALACRAAIDGGLPEHIAFNISDGYIRQIDAITSPEQINTLIYRVIITNCTAVHDYNLSHLSAPIKQCCEYFHVKMHGNITLAELSNVCHLSPNYISDLFRKELGVGAIQYFQTMKLNRAAYFLEHTTLPVSGIAATLGFPSHSHFAARFKKHFGISPLEYRKTHTSPASMNK